MIVGHLDLDAFFAAVEELEDPSLRTKPLVVGGDPHGRGVVATANYVARKFGIHSAMSCAEALRRCPQTVFVRARHSLYREYSQHVWETVRGVVPTVERTGLDEGYLDIGEVAQTFLEARKVAEAVQTAVRAATSLTCALGVSHVEGGREDRERPSQARRADRGRRPVRRRASWRRSTCAGSPESGRRRRSACSPRASRRSARWPCSATSSSAACFPAASGGVLHDRARGIDPRGLEHQTRAHLDQRREHVRARPDRSRAAARRAAPHGRPSRGDICRRRGRTARTVSTKLRYTDFSIRTRSTSLRVGIDEPAKIGELACALLDRALARPPRRASARRSRRFGAGESPAARARLIRSHFAGDVCTADDPNALHSHAEAHDDSLRS